MGILISIITIKGETCKISTLIPLGILYVILQIITFKVEMTKGNVTRINPEELSNDFANILSDELVATNAYIFLK